VVPPKQYEAMLRLLAAFAQHLTLVANQLVLQAANTAPPNITHAREYIVAHENEDLSPADVAKAVNMSTYYF
jgi:AraC-like DNA-binding protein